MFSGTKYNINKLIYSIVSFETATKRKQFIAHRLQHIDVNRWIVNRTYTNMHRKRICNARIRESRAKNWLLSVVAAKRAEKSFSTKLSRNEQYSNSFYAFHIQSYRVFLLCARCVDRCFLYVYAMLIEEMIRKANSFKCQTQNNKKKLKTEFSLLLALIEFYANTSRRLIKWRM